MLRIRLNETQHSGKNKNSPCPKTRGVENDLCNVAKQQVGVDLVRAGTYTRIPDLYPATQLYVVL